MSNKITFVFISACLLILNNCSFTSQSRSKSPHFDGSLKFSGEAIENAKIILSLSANDKLCLKGKKFTTTNAQGEFSLKAATEEYTYTPFVNYALDEWTLCAIYNEQTYTLYSNNRYGSGNVTGSIFLECDLALNPVNKPCVVSH
ncbi:MAG: hypothetical protein OQK98_07465 [Gammaproteobacteria bacterium]|nr:hypothetical protein [Gammaproteobacteria bacterium]